jgi:sulfonate transport system substrate-binding protein
MVKINIGGVPEHFNLPWHQTIREGQYFDKDIDLKWKDFPGGTGAMCASLRNKEIDIAVILTEGIIKDIIDGNPSKILQTYIQTPLNWGIHVAFDSPYKTVNDLKGKKAAISRYGSGSHLMAFINAKNNDWDIKNDLDFEVVKNLDGAVEKLKDGSADYFLWEKFTTKPLVDNDTFRRIDNCPSPWSCFVIAARKEFIENHPEKLKHLLDIINTATQDFKDIPNIDNMIAEAYDQQLKDVQEWLSITEWSQNPMDEHMILDTQEQLFALNIIPEIVSYKMLTHKL